jgi:protease-4
MAKPRFDPGTLPNLLYNLSVELANQLAALPGKRPEWLVLEVSGSYPVRAQKRKLTEFPPALGPRPETLESFQRKLGLLARAPWLKGISLRCQSLELAPATAYALRRAVLDFKRSGKRVLCLLDEVSMSSYYLASAADEVIVPESASFGVTGLALGVLFMRDALARYGVHFEKLAIREYKNALDQFVRQDMSEAQREQYEALLESAQREFLGAVAGSRKVTPQTVKSWIDEGVTSAERARELGMVDSVAYEDEALRGQQAFAAGARFLRRKRRPLAAKRIAFVSLSGLIVPGKSRNIPLPLPILGGPQAGSETMIRALRQAEGDSSTEAIVFYVDSGGGSALASDLIWREIARIRSQKPVVAVMGTVAASGGYYVLTHAHHVIAAPMTVTGSIGVISGKPVLEGFNSKYGLNPETLSRGRYALTNSPDKPYSEAERAFVERAMTHIYEQFIRKVAEGRKLSRERVDELGRGRIWSGADALERGLVDELGDVALAIERAREMAGLSEGAAVWNVEAPAKMLLPTAQDPSTLVRALRPLLRERCLLLHPAQLALE